MKRAIWICVWTLSLSLGLAGCRWDINFHVVDPGKLYRSAQLTAPELTEAIQRLGIRTVINLRGANPSLPWFRDENHVTESLGVRRVDIGMSAKRFPHREDLIKLLDAFRDSPRPILIHCQAGADRTGEAVAIYMMEYMKLSKAQAMGALSPQFLHIERFTPAKDAFIRLYGGETWARSFYDPCKQSYRFYDQKIWCGPKPTSNIPEDDSHESEAVTAQRTCGDVLGIVAQAHF